MRYFTLAFPHEVVFQHEILYSINEKFLACGRKGHIAGLSFDFSVNTGCSSETNGAKNSPAVRHARLNLSSSVSSRGQGSGNRSCAPASAATRRRERRRHAESSGADHADAGALGRPELSAEVHEACPISASASTIAQVEKTVARLKKELPRALQGN